MSEDSLVLAGRWHMAAMHCPVVLVTSLVSVLSVLMQTAAGEIAYTCLDGPDTTLDINCGQGNMVHITSAFYGFSASGHCRLVDGGPEASCVKEDKEPQECVGRSRCAINLPTSHRGPYLTTCRQTTNYYQVHYTCVPADSVHDICQEDKLMDQSGYIKTPRYPLNYKQQGICSIIIMVNPDQKVNLKIIDMNLKDGGKNSCEDYLYFNDKLHSITLCSHRYNHTYNWRSNYLRIEVQSTSGGLSKGFWLYYEATPPLLNSLPKPEPQPPVSDSNDHIDNEDDGDNSHTSYGENGRPDGRKGNDPYDENTTPVYKNPESTVPLIRNNRRSSKKLPFAAIAGGVIGTLSLILVILLFMLLVKWLKERQYYRAEKILEIRNPAFRSSGDFYEQQQPNNNDYNYC